MTQKSKFLKNLLTSASVIAVTASAGSAMAEDYFTTAAAATTLSTIANGNVNVEDGSAANVTTYVSPSTFTFNHVSAVTTATDLNITKLDLNNKAGTTLIVNSNVELDSVVSTGGVQTVAITVADTKTLSLTGSSMTALGNVVLTGAGGELNINGEYITITGTVNGAAPSNGIINVNDGSTFEGLIGGTNSILEMTVAEEKTATISVTGEHKIDTISLGEGSGLSVTKDDTTITGAIEGTLDDDGAASSIITVSGNNTIFAGNIGEDGKALKSIEVKGAGVELNLGGHAYVENITSTSHNLDTLKLTTANSIVKANIGADTKKFKLLDFAEDGIKLTGAVEATTVDFTKAGTITGAVNAVDINFTEAGTITGVVTADTVNFTKAGTITGAVTADTVNFTEAGIVDGDITAAIDITVANGLDVTFTGNISATNAIEVSGAAASLTFNTDKSVVNSEITFTAAGEGTVNLTDTKEVLKQIGATGAKAALIDFSAGTKGAVTKIGASLYGNAIAVGEQELKIIDDVTLEGTDTTMTGSTLSLGTKNLTLTGDSTFATSLTINTTFDGTKIGHIILGGAGSTLDASSLEINLTIEDSTLRVNESKSYEMIELNGGTLNNAPTLKVADTSRFNKWEASGTTLTVSNETKHIMMQDFAGKANSNVMGVVEKLSGTVEGNARKLVTAIGKGTAEQSIDTVKRLSESTSVGAQKAMSGAINGASVAMGARMNNLHANAAGMAAGEGDAISYGVWATPFYSTTTQKEWKDSAGYKANATGATIGVDALVNDDLTMGVAGSYINTDMKHNDAKSGDTTKADSIIFSLYAMQELSNNWFVQGQASVANNKMNSTEKRTQGGVAEYATGKFNTSSYTAELLTGYNYNMKLATGYNNAMSDVSVTPLAGASFSRINSYAYSETGTILQNRDVKAKASNKIEAILGLKVQSRYDVKGVTLTPEMHVMAKHDFVGKTGKVALKIDGLTTDLINNAASTEKTTLNVGFGVNAAAGIYEYGAGYDLNMTKKSLGHQGTLKVRLNF